MKQSVICIGYEPNQHQKLKSEGYEVTSIDPKPVNNYHWVNGTEIKEAIFTHPHATEKLPLFDYERLHHVYKGSVHSFIKTLPNNKYDKVLINDYSLVHLINTNKLLKDE